MIHVLVASGWCDEGVSLSFLWRGGWDVRVVHCCICQFERVPAFLCTHTQHSSWCCCRAHTHVYVCAFIYVCAPVIVWASPNLGSGLVFVLHTPTWRCVYAGRRCCCCCWLHMLSFLCGRPVHPVHTPRTARAVISALVSQIMGDCRLGTHQNPHF